MKTDRSQNTPKNQSTDNAEVLLKFFREFAQMCRESAGGYMLYATGAQLWIEDSFEFDEDINELTRYMIIGFLVHNHDDPERTDVVWPVTLSGPVDPRQYTDIAVEFANGRVEDLNHGRCYRNVADWALAVRERVANEKERAREEWAAAQGKKV